MTGSVICLVRHAEAGERAAWTRADPERPLTAAGRRQSEALVRSLSAIPLKQLISSPFVRCVQTLEPLSAARGLPLQRRDELAEGEPIEHVEKIALEAATIGSAAVCVHGDGIRAVLQGLIDRDVELDGDRHDHAKGSTWILRIIDGVIVSGRYEPPLDRGSPASDINSRPGRG